MNPELLRYILDNRDRYTREAIDASLLSAGYNRDQIEEAWSAAEAGVVAPSGPTSPPVYEPSSETGPAPESGLAPQTQGPILKKSRFWLTFIGYILASYGAPILLAFIDPTFISPLVVGLVALLGACIGAVLLWNRNYPVAVGLLSGVVTVVLLPFVLVVIVAGLCFAGLAGGIAG